jgi:hypothetical protein
MSLQFLIFDLSEDEHGHGCLDALASATPAQLPRLLAEVAQVLDWAHAQFPDGPGDLDDGATWNLDLQSRLERSQHEQLDYDLAHKRFQREPQGPVAERHSVSLTLSGTAAFCQAFTAHFGGSGDDD